MLLTYDINKGVLFNQSKECSRISYDIGNFESAEIYVDNQRLYVSIPAFTLVNIYYKIGDGLVYLSSDLGQLVTKDCRQPSEEYIPLSGTAYDGIYIFCSFLTYTFDKDGVVLAPVDIMKGDKDIYSVFLAECSRLADSMNEWETVIPLSGGMDSRVLAFLFQEKCPILYTHGEKNSGDIILARRVATVLGMTNIEFDIENFTITDLKNNILLSDNFLAGNRLLYKSSDEFCKSDHYLISGLYGDIIFKRAKKIDFIDYAEKELAPYNLTNTDYDILKCYASFVKTDIHAKVLLRCQKLTRMSLIMNKRGYPVAPWVTNAVIGAISVNYSGGTYETFVKSSLPRDLRTIIHQSTQSIFTHPMFFRISTKIALRLTGSPIAKPYFSKKTLDRLGL